MGLPHTNATESHFWLATRLVVGAWLVKTLLEPIHELAALPPELFEPTGVLRLLPWPPTGSESEAGWMAFRFILIAVCVGGLFRRTGRWCLLFACIMVTVSQSALRGFRHVNHEELALLWALYILTAFHFVIGRSPTPSTNPYRAPLVLVAFVFCLTYLLVGATRISEGIWDGFAIFRGESIVSMTLYQAYHPGMLGVGLGEWVMHSTPLQWSLRIGFPIITALEVLAPFCLLWRRFRFVFVAAMLGFHVGAFVLMRITFVENLVLFPFLFDWSPGAQREQVAERQVREG